MKNNTNGNGYQLLNSSLFLLIGTLFSLTVPKGCVNQKIEVHPMVKVTRDINISCPVMVDQITRMDSVAFLSDTIFQYYYSLVTQEVNSIDIEGLTRYLTPRITNNIITNPDLKMQRDHNLTMVFHYRDWQGAFITQLTIGPADYRK